MLPPRVPDSRFRDLAFTLLLLMAALLACKKNDEASQACATSGEADSEACQQCCQQQGANGHKYVAGKCECLGE